MWPNIDNIFSRHSCTFPTHFCSFDNCHFSAQNWSGSQLNFYLYCFPLPTRAGWSHSAATGQWSSQRRTLMQQKGSSWCSKSFQCLTPTNTNLFFNTHFYKMPRVGLVVDVWKERLHKGLHSGGPIYCITFEIHKCLLPTMPYFYSHAHQPFIVLESYLSVTKCEMWRPLSSRKWRLASKAAGSIAPLPPLTFNHRSVEQQQTWKKKYFIKSRVGWPLLIVLHRTWLLWAT